LNGLNISKSFSTKEHAFEWYKNQKELNIKRIADKWKGMISEKLYNAMIEYKVEITD
jgi:hypothetical protein